MSDPVAGPTARSASQRVCRLVAGNGTSVEEPGRALNALRVAVLMFASVLDWIIPSNAGRKEPCFLSRVDMD